MNIDKGCRGMYLMNEEWHTVVTEGTPRKSQHQKHTTMGLHKCVVIIGAFFYQECNQITGVLKMLAPDTCDRKDRRLDSLQNLKETPRVSYRQFTITASIFTTHGLYLNVVAASRF